MLGVDRGCFKCSLLVALFHITHSRFSFGEVLSGLKAGEVNYWLQRLIYAES